MPAADALPQLDSWPAIIIAVCAAAAGLLVPLTSFLKTFFDYRIEAAKAEKLKPEVARDVAQATGGMLFDSIAIADLTAAIKGLTAAIVADTASEEAHHSSQMAAAVTRFTEMMDRFESNGRGGRR